MTVSEQAKQFGAKVKRNDTGWYTYIGKNFTVDFSKATCEYTWWEVEWYEDDVDTKVVEFFYSDNNFPTKNEVMADLLYLDQELENQK